MACARKVPATRGALRTYRGLKFWVRGVTPATLALCGRAVHAQAASGPGASRPARCTAQGWGFGFKTWGLPASSACASGEWAGLQPLDQRSGLACGERQGDMPRRSPGCVVAPARQD